jgi:thiol-disulfide isomerase/thioredoxin
MRRHWPQFTCLLFCTILAVPSTLQPSAFAQQEGFGASAPPSGIHWQQDLEAAKTAAKQTGRLVLVHFWTPSCAPCLVLDQTVFNQPGVAAAVEAQFVPVKLNANENPATAQGFGITRVPTDVILTADGQVVGKLISPPTPAGYIAELNQVASQYSSTPGQAFANAAAKAPAPSQLNPAYANLPLNPNTPPAIAQPVAAPPAESIGHPFARSGITSPTATAITPPAGSPSMAASPITSVNPLTSASVSAPSPVGFAPPAVATQPPAQAANRYGQSPIAAPSSQT